MSESFWAYPIGYRFTNCLYLAVSLSLSQIKPRNGNNVVLFQTFCFPLTVKFFQSKKKWVTSWKSHCTVAALQKRAEYLWHSQPSMESSLFCVHLLHIALQWTNTSLNEYIICLIIDNVILFLAFLPMLSTPGFILSNLTIICLREFNNR